MDKIKSNMNIFEQSVMQDGSAQKTLSLMQAVRDARRYKPQKKIASIKMD